jgi:hypothetical protein
LASQLGGLTLVLANSGVHSAGDSVPQGGTAVTVRIGTFRIVPLTLSTLQMYSFSIGDQVTLLSDTGPRGAAGDAGDTRDARSARPAGPAVR